MPISRPFRPELPNFADSETLREVVASLTATDTWARSPVARELMLFTMRKYASGGKGVASRSGRRRLRGISCLSHPNDTRGRRPVGGCDAGSTTVDRSRGARGPADDLL